MQPPAVAELQVATDRVETSKRRNFRETRNDETAKSEIMQNICIGMQNAEMELHSLTSQFVTDTSSPPPAIA